MTTLKIEKRASLPGALTPNTMYLCADTSDATKLSVVITDNAGTGTKRTINQADLTLLAGTMVKRADQVTKTSDMTQRLGVDANGVLWTPPVIPRTVTNYVIPNVGDSIVLRIGDQNVLVVTKTDAANQLLSTPVLYSTALKSFSQNTTISYLRSWTRGGATVAAKNASGVVLQSTQNTAVDTGLRADFRDEYIIALLTESTGEVWRANIYAYGTSNLRIIVVKD